jgi:hypothetical protein
MESKSLIVAGQRGLQLTTLDDMWRFAKAVKASNLSPKGMSVEDLFITIQMGAEIGLPPMASTQNIASINGRPAVYGDAMLGLVRSTGELEAFEEWYENSKGRLKRKPATLTDDLVAVCRVKRRGYPDAEVSFSVAEAKQAKLVGKPGPWSDYPTRQLQMRARGFALRDHFPDVLKGIRGFEEVLDSPAELDVTPRAPVFHSQEPEPEPEIVVPAVEAPAMGPLQQRLADSGLTLEEIRERVGQTVEFGYSSFAEVPEKVAALIIRSKVLEGGAE